jgi:long-subunit acyl-CoA synthetase (AMP-forming)
MEDEAAEADEADEAIIVYTSGTPHEGASRHHRAVWTALAQITSLGLRDAEHDLYLPTRHHSGRAVFLKAMALLAGASVMIPAFEPGDVLLEVAEATTQALRDRRLHTGDLVEINDDGRCAPSID